MNADTPAGALLRAAAAICDGDRRIPGLSQSRAACLLARQALEQVIDSLLEARGLSCPRASMRVRLLCLRHGYRDAPGAASRAENAWSRLSAACHHHAYELSPTPGEARALVTEVRRLARVGSAGDGTAGVGPAGGGSGAVESL